MKSAKPQIYDGVSDMQQQKINLIKKHLAEQFNLPPEQIELLMPSFISTLQTHMNNLFQALEGDNPHAIGELGHTIKGAFLNLGLEECAAIALTIERRGKAGDHLANYRQLYDELQNTLRSISE